MFKPLSLQNANDESVRVARAKVGLETDRTTFIPEVGTLLWTKDTKNLYIGDGSTPGGILYKGDLDENLLERILSDPDLINQIANAININNGTKIGNIDGGRF